MLRRLLRRKKPEDVRSAKKKFKIGNYQFKLQRSELDFIPGEESIGHDAFCAICHGFPDKWRFQVSSQIYFFSIKIAFHKLVYVNKIPDFKIVVFLDDAINKFTCKKCKDTYLLFPDTNDNDIIRPWIDGLIALCEVHKLSIRETRKYIIVDEYFHIRLPKRRFF